MSRESENKMTRFGCSFEGCDVDPATGGAVYRTSPKGGPFEGRCLRHLSLEQRADLDPSVRQIVEAVEGDTGWEASHV